jgi:hypothetical protein
MTEQESSGAPANPAPAATPGAPAAASATPEFGTFGNTRGSGLARGKRAVTTAAPAASAVTGEYKPTAIEVVVPQREYRNPFGDPTPAPEPAPAAPTPPPAPAAHPPQPVQATEAAPSTGAQEAEIPEKAELNILPPADAKRPPVHWGNTSAPGASPGAPGVFQTRARREENRDERFQPRGEPRRDAAYEGRDPRREPRHEHRMPGDQREETRAPVHHSEPAKPQGFFAWLKSLFGAKPAERPAHGEFTREGDQFQRGRSRWGAWARRHGEGHYGQSGPPREGGQSDFRGGPSEFRGGRPDYRGGDQEGGGHHDGQRRRRHRGGRGRDRGDSRSEGSQGGGAI